MATSSTANAPARSAGSRVSAQTGYPEGSLRFDWIMAGLSALFLAGLWVDGWAHFHNRVDQSFFTPWHLLFYSSFAIIALFTGFHQVRNINRGFAFQRALPKGYWLSLIGVVIFALSGFGDMIWHTLFGIEAGTEALTSPSHIGLGVGIALIVTGAVRSMWIRGRDSAAPLTGWRNLAPMLICVTLFTALVLFLTSYANPIVNPRAAITRTPSVQDFGVTGILLTTAILGGISALLARRWTSPVSALPFGTFMLLFGGSTALLTIMNDVYVLLIGAAAAGLIIDVIYWLLKPSADRLNRFYLFSFLVPALYFTFYFVTIHIMNGRVGIMWSVHVWTGAIFLSGIVGLLMAVALASGQPNAVDHPAKQPTDT